MDKLLTKCGGWNTIKCVSLVHVKGQHNNTKTSTNSSLYQECLTYSTIQLAAMLSLLKSMLMLPANQKIETSQNEGKGDGYKLKIVSILRYSLLK